MVSGILCKKQYGFLEIGKGLGRAKGAGAGGMEAAGLSPLR